jgi:hypothetical protein
MLSPLLFNLYSERICHIRPRFCFNEEPVPNVLNSRHTVAYEETDTQEFNSIFATKVL